VVRENAVQLLFVWKRLPLRSGFLTLMKSLNANSHKYTKHEPWCSFSQEMKCQTATFSIDGPRPFGVALLSSISYIIVGKSYSTIFMDTQYPKLLRLAAETDHFAKSIRRLLQASISLYRPDYARRHFSEGM
jgi:hypothetical protein